MKFIQLKVLSFVRKNTEVFLLMLLLVVSTLVIQVYNSQSKKVDNEYIKILRKKQALSSVLRAFNNNISLISLNNIIIINRII